MPARTRYVQRVQPWETVVRRDMISAMQKSINSLDKEVERLEQENAKLTAENNRWIHRIKALESITATIRNLVR